MRWAYCCVSEIFDSQFSLSPSEREIFFLPIVSCRTFKISWNIPFPSNNALLPSSVLLAIIFHSFDTEDLYRWSISEARSNVLFFVSRAWGITLVIWGRGTFELIFLKRNFSWFKLVIAHYLYFRAIVLVRISTWSLYKLELFHRPCTSCLNADKCWCSSRIYITAFIRRRTVINSWLSSNHGLVLPRNILSTGKYTYLGRYARHMLCCWRFFLCSDLWCYGWASGRSCQLLAFRTNNFSVFDWLTCWATSDDSWTGLTVKTLRLYGPLL